LSSRMRPSIVSDDDDVDDGDQLAGSASLSAAVNALATSTGARRQVRLAVPLGGAPSAAGGGSRSTADDDRRDCRATLSERSLFIFSEENFIRKYAKIIIEWGYPLRVKCCTYTFLLSYASWCHTTSANRQQPRLQCVHVAL